MEVGEPDDADGLAVDGYSEGECVCECPCADVPGSPDACAGVGNGGSEGSENADGGALNACCGIEP